MATDAQRAQALRKVAADMEHAITDLLDALFDPSIVAASLGHLMTTVAATATALAEHIEEH